ncbi:MAG: dihydroxy-acid dehydratase [Frankiaceae bacterium]|nr:dihydroxy-acid dehydratase [Frankiaceae bacterium]
MTAELPSSAALDGDAGFAARTFLRSGGLTAEQVRRRPIIGICSSWSELTPCNLPLQGIAEHVRHGVEQAGGTALVFPTISLSEALVRPTTMFLRNLMSIDVEEMITASPIDGVVLLNGCDKTVAAQLMGAISADKPAISLGAGIRPRGEWCGRALTIDDSWRLIEERRAGLLDDEAWADVEGRVSPGPGVCNVLGTAVTLAMVAEVLGLALPGSSLQDAGSDEQAEFARLTGAAVVRAVREDVRPRRLVTRQALLDAWRLVCALGGSTNAAIHLMTLAGRAGVDLTLNDLADAGRETPTLGRVKPNGPYDLDDLRREGGVAATLGALSAQTDLGHPTADGRRWRDVVDALPPGPSRALASSEMPQSPSAAIAVLHGSLAPSGAVIKCSAASPHLLRHTGPAVVFDGVDDMRNRIDDESLALDESCVLVLRNCGPVGGPGMPEAGAIPIPVRLWAQGVRDMVRISDARMSGTAAGTIVLHIAPEAAVGGPLSLVRDGDLISLDVEAGRLDLLVEDDEFARRSAGTAATVCDLPQSRGYMWLHQRHVMQAHEGCDFDFLQHSHLDETARTAEGVA